MTDIAALTLTELAGLYRRKELSPVEATQNVLARIERFEPAVNAFARVDAEGALAAARAAEARWQKGAPLGPVDGVPTTIKDQVWVKGLPMRRGSLTTPTTPSTEDGPATARLREQGAVILGTTTMPEFGWIGACHSPLTGITRNPWNLGRTPGGSSGGAAVAALLNLGWLHLGTDAAGSVRIPAAFSGVFAIKPSFGRVPAYPSSPFGVMAHVGPLARTVGEAATMLSVIGGPDMRDMTAWNTPAPDFRIGLEDGVRTLRIAWSPRLGYKRTIHPDIAAATARAVRAFEELGAHVEEADPDLPDCAAILRPLWYGTSAAIAAQMSPEARAKMDPGYRRIAELGARYGLADWQAAYVARSDVFAAMRRFHERYDLLLTPTMPVPALEVGAVVPKNGDYGDEWIEWSPFTYPFNMTQQPAASVPCGFTNDGLPIGLQIVGPPRNDTLVLRAARAFESARPWRSLSEPMAA
jgi:aspartyl-tRNA(Asn)/glutamyl-tRNA(Gln) amidotransferase subunit A